MFKRLWKWSELKRREPTLEAFHRLVDDMSPDQLRHAENIQNIALSNLETQHEALQKNLRLTLVSVVIAFFVGLVAIGASVIAFHAKQNITVQVVQPKTVQPTP